MKRTNAREEFEQHVKSKTVICANLQYPYRPGNFVLKMGYSEDEYQEFIKSLDWEYTKDETFDKKWKMILNGNIWYSDGSWSDRQFTSDGFGENWMCRTPPQIPEICQDLSHLVKSASKC